MFNLPAGCARIRQQLSDEFSMDFFCSDCPLFNHSRRFVRRLRPKTSHSLASHRKPVGNRLRNHQLHFPRRTPPWVFLLGQHFCFLRRVCRLLPWNVQLRNQRKQTQGASLSTGQAGWSRNHCRCGGHPHLAQAVRLAGFLRKFRNQRRRHDFCYSLPLFHCRWTIEEWRNRKKFERKKSERKKSERSEVPHQSFCNSDLGHARPVNKKEKTDFNVFDLFAIRLVLLLLADHRSEDYALPVHASRVQHFGFRFRHLQRRHQHLPRRLSDDCRSNFESKVKNSRRDAHRHHSGNRSHFIRNLSLCWFALAVLPGKTKKNVFLEK